MYLSIEKYWEDMSNINDAMMTCPKGVHKAPVSPVCSALQDITGITLKFYQDCSNRLKGFCRHTNTHMYRWLTGIKMVYLYTYIYLCMCACVCVFLECYFCFLFVFFLHNFRL